MATNIEPEVLMNSILGNIADVLLNGDGEVIPKSDDHYLAFMSPGMPIDPESFRFALEGFGGVERRNANQDNLDTAVGPQEEGEGQPAADPAALAADVRRKYQAAEVFAAICDQVPDTSGIVETGRINTWNPETRISHAYALALQFSQVYNVEPDEETKRKLDRWRSLLQTTKIEKDLVTEEEIEVTTESELAKKYREKMLAYYGEALAYNTARISALAGQDPQAVHQFAINGPLMQMKVRAAENDWISNGYRDTVDRINAAIAAVEGRSFALLKQRYKEDYFRSVLTSPASGANFLYTAPTPPDFALSNAGWSQFEFNSSSYKSDYKFSKKDVRGKGSFGLGFIKKASASASYEKSTSSSKIDIDKFSMTFELCRCSIYRPAINLAFLKSGFWRFDKNNQEYKTTLLSDGKTPPNGLMPAITTDCIFIRNLKLKFGSYASELERESKKTDVKTSFSFGPFGLGGGFSGGYSSNSYDRNYEATWDSQGVSINGIQLIGFLCYALDKCPDPNPNVTDWI